MKIITWCVPPRTCTSSCGTCIGGCGSHARSRRLNTSSRTKSTKCVRCQSGTCGHFFTSFRVRTYVPTNLPCVYTYIQVSYIYYPTRSGRPPELYNLDVIVNMETASNEMAGPCRVPCLPLGEGERGAPLPPFLRIVVRKDLPHRTGFGVSRGLRCGLQNVHHGGG